MHNPIIPAGHLVQAERVVEMMVSDPALDQWTRRVREPARPA